MELDLQTSKLERQSGRKPGATSEQLDQHFLHSGLIDMLLRRRSHDGNRVQEERTVSLEDVTFI